MTEDRKLKALFACEKFLRESQWNVHTGLIADLWLAAVEWADDNLSDSCSVTGLGNISIGRFRGAKTEIRNENKVRRVPTEKKY